MTIHFGEELAKGRIIGHKCPQCGKVYMPPRGYCPLCVVETTEADEVEVANEGTITTFSVITPLQYQGQEETEDYVQGTLLLDGADTTIMVMRMDGIPIADVRMGMRVRAVWPPEAKRPATSRSIAAWASATRSSAGNRPASPTSLGSRSRSTFCDGAALMRDVAIVSFAQAPLEQPPGSDRDADVVADDHRGAGGRRDDAA